jgi:hypothetical protein
MEQRHRRRIGGRQRRRQSGRGEQAEKQWQQGFHGVCLIVVQTGLHVASAMPFAAGNGDAFAALRKNDLLLFPEGVAVALSGHVDPPPGA